MKANPFNIILSEFDEKRFGIRTAHAANIKQENLINVLDFCANNKVVFLVARCETKATHAIHAMQRAGFLLMGTLIRYSVEVDKIAHPPEVEIFPVRPVRPSEEDGVRAVALKAFRGYRTHYHSDNKLDPEKCDGIYASMAYDACLDEAETSIVYVCEMDGEIIGFDIKNTPSPGVGEGVLMAITPAAQKRGVGWSFVQPKKDWFQTKAVTIANSTTQITNIASQNFLIAQNYMPSASFYTFHKWFN